MTKLPKISDEESALFKSAIGDVKPVHSNLADIQEKRPEAIPKKAQEDDRAVLKELLSDQITPDEFDSGEHLQFARPGMQKSVVRKLKKGQYARQASLDLHGHTQVEARKALTAFIAQAQRTQARCVLIIHGKSRHSAEKAPVLKPKVSAWLRSHPEVLAFCSAQPSEGGTGALYVLLRQLK